MLNLDPVFSPWLIWFLLGIGLAFLELQLPGFIVVFFGIGCWVVAGALLIWDLALSHQIALFICSSIGSILLLRRFFVRAFRGSSSDSASDEFDEFPKKEKVKVTKSITPDCKGRVAYRGTTWNAVSDEHIESGEIVELAGYANNSRQVFFVKKI